MRIRIQIQASIYRLNPLEKCSIGSYIPYILACHMLIDEDPVDFYLMRIRVRKMMRIHVDPDPQHGVKLSHFRILSKVFPSQNLNL
jgi:hypothetical protein